MALKQWNKNKLQNATIGAFSNVYRARIEERYVVKQQTTIVPCIRFLIFRCLYRGKLTHLKWCRHRKFNRQKNISHKIHWYRMATSCSIFEADFRSNYPCPMNPLESQVMVPIESMSSQHKNECTKLWHYLLLQIVQSVVERIKHTQENSNISGLNCKTQKIQGKLPVHTLNEEAGTFHFQKFVPDPKASKPKPDHHSLWSGELSRT